LSIDPRPIVNGYRPHPITQDGLNFLYNYFDEHPEVLYPTWYPFGRYQGGSQIPQADGDFLTNIQRVNHNDDPQNVHNSTVVKEITKVFNRLETLNKTDFPSTSEVALSAEELKSEIINATFAEIRERAPRDPTDAQKVEQVLAEISKGGYVSCLNSTEDWVMCQIWRRTNSPDNAAKCEELKTTFINNLLDCITHHESGLIFGIMPNGVECIQGRVSRMLSTFMLLDNDPLLAAPIKDDKEFENEAYTKAGAIISQEQANPPEEFAGIDEIYKKDDAVLTEEEVEKMKSYEVYLKKRIRETLEKDYMGVIDRVHLEAIITNAQQGVDI
jgi:hypothetical protein